MSDDLRTESDYRQAQEQRHRAVSSESRRARFRDDVFTGNVTFCRFTAQPCAEFLEYAARLSDVSLGQFVAATMQLVSCDEVCSSESIRTRACVSAEC